MTATISGFRRPSAASCSARGARRYARRTTVRSHHERSESRLRPFGTGRTGRESAPNGLADCLEGRPQFESSSSPSSKPSKLWPLVQFRSASFSTRSGVDAPFSSSGKRVEDRMRTRLRALKEKCSDESTDLSFESIRRSDRQS
jgi:hypothetical protein